MKLFNAFYNSFYTLACIVLFGLLLITPADTIRQALSNNQLYNVFVIAGAFVLTLILVILIVAQRLYTNKSVLKAIPKTWVPVEKGDVNKKVRKMIVASLVRSAIIAWEARPRIHEPPTTTTSVLEPDAQDAVNPPPATTDSKEKESRVKKGRSPMEREEEIIVVPRQLEWEDILHDGWSSPTSADLPDLEFSTVVMELPHLIEARAVSLAPPDPYSTSVPVLPDIRVVDVLQRPAAMGLQEYINYLISVGVMASTSTTMGFLALYEHARFSGHPLEESQFRQLMQLFADLLRSMNGLSPDVLERLDIYPAEVESDIDEDGSNSSTPTTTRSRSLLSVEVNSIHSGSEGTIRTAPSWKARGTSSKRDFSTAPATPRSKKHLTPKSPSSSTFLRSRRPLTSTSSSSGSSLRSSSQNSVIRLSRTDDNGDLPYTLTVPRMR